MTKKRNCRRSDEETALHNEAVRLRKMTDAQLVSAVRNGRQTKEPAPDKVKALLDGLAAGECKGVGGATVFKIRQFAADKGFVTNG